MLSQASQRLVDDHAALDDLLGQLWAALESGDVACSHAKLDLFWARLGWGLTCCYRLAESKLGFRTSNAAGGIYRRNRHSCVRRDS